MRPVPRSCRTRPLWRPRRGHAMIHPRETTPWSAGRTPRASLVRRRGARRLRHGARADARGCGPPRARRALRRGHRHAGGTAHARRRPTRERRSRGDSRVGRPSRRCAGGVRQVGPEQRRAGVRAHRDDPGGARHTPLRRGRAPRARGHGDRTGLARVAASPRAVARRRRTRRGGAARARSAACRRSRRCRCVARARVRRVARQRPLCGAARLWRGAAPASRRSRGRRGCRPRAARPAGAQRRGRGPAARAAAAAGRAGRRQAALGHAGRAARSDAALRRHRCRAGRDRPADRRGARGEGCRHAGAPAPRPRARACASASAGPMRSPRSTACVPTGSRCRPSCARPRPMRCSRCASRTRRAPSTPKCSPPIRPTATRTWASCSPASRTRTSAPPSPPPTRSPRPAGRGSTSQNDPAPEPDMDWLDAQILAAMVRNYADMNAEAWRRIDPLASGRARARVSARQPRQRRRRARLAAPRRRRGAHRAVARARGSRHPGLGGRFGHAPPRMARGARAHRRRSRRCFPEDAEVQRVVRDLRAHDMYELRAGLLRPPRDRQRERRAGQRPRLQCASLLAADRRALARHRRVRLPDREADRGPRHPPARRRGGGVAVARRDGGGDRLGQLGRHRQRRRDR